MCRIWAAQRRKWGSCRRVTTPAIACGSAARRRGRACVRTGRALTSNLGPCPPRRRLDDVHPWGLRRPQAPAHRTTRPRDPLRPTVPPYARPSLPDRRFFGSQGPVSAWGCPLNRPYAVSIPASTAVPELRGAAPQTPARSCKPARYPRSYPCITRVLTGRPRSNERVRGSD